MSKTLFKGAAYLTVAGVICKLLGALYRAPLTAVLGEEGLGIYQLVFPFYCILLTLSSTGIPTALSKLIAEGKDPERLFKKSLYYFGGAGLALSLAVFFAAPYIAGLQGNAGATGAYKAIAPSVFFVSVLSCVRGYFQGRKNTLPTAVTQITEQVVKLLFGLTLCTLFGNTPTQKAVLATLSVTLSEVAAVFIAMAFYGKKNKTLSGDTAGMKKILQVVFPITLSAIMIPLSKTVDGFLVVNLLNAERVQATALYGLYSGAAESIVSMPVALCYSFAVVSVPEISSDKSDVGKRFDAVYYTLALGVIAGVMTYLFAGVAVRVLYGGLSETNAAVLVALIKTASAQVVGLSLLQTLGATLVALDKYYIPPLILSVGIGAKILASFALIPSPLGILSCALIDSIVYLSVAVAEFVVLMILSLKRNRVKTVGNFALKNNGNQ